MTFPYWKFWNKNKKGFVLKLEMYKNSKRHEKL